MDDQERQNLLDDLVARLKAERAPAGMRLLELMRTEQNLVEALAVIRREIDAIIQTSRPIDPDA